MSEFYSALGALLLGAAFVPQVWRLARRRSAQDFAWSFVLLNLAGLMLLSFRSAELGETSFLAINLAAAGFWLFAFAVKAWESANPLPAEAPSRRDAKSPARPAAP